VFWVFDVRKIVSMVVMQEICSHRKVVRMALYLEECLMSNQTS